MVGKRASSVGVKSLPPQALVHTPNPLHYASVRPALEPSDVLADHRQGIREWREIQGLAELLGYNIGQKDFLLFGKGLPHIVDGWESYANHQRSSHGRQRAREASRVGYLP